MPLAAIIAAAPRDDAAQKERLAERYRVASVDYWHGVVIFGAAKLGATIARQLRAIGVEVAGFTDNDPRRWGSEYEGLPLMAPGDIPASQPMVIASKYVKDIAAGLGERAFRPIPHYLLPIFHPQHFEGIYHHLSASLIQESREEILEAYAMLEDDASRRLFATLIKFRLTLDPLDLPDAEPDQYFPGFWPWAPAEAYVDIGACDGDTLRDFLARADGRFARYVALEPDPANLKTLRASIPASFANKVAVVPQAAGAVRGTVSFVGNLGGESRVGSGGDITAEVAPLDEIVAGQPVTAIKVDVEGYEAEVLEGARQTLARCRPKLALSVYHKIPDLWTLPLWLKRQGCEYRYRMRHHTPEIYDTVLYCLPPEPAS